MKSRRDRRCDIQPCAGLRVYQQVGRSAHDDEPACRVGVARGDEFMEQCVLYRLMVKCSERAVREAPRRIRQARRG